MHQHFPEIMLTQTLTVYVSYVRVDGKAVESIGNKQAHKQTKKQTYIQTLNIMQ